MCFVLVWVVYVVVQIMLIVVNIDTIMQENCQTCLTIKCYII